MVRNLTLERLAALLATILFCATGLAGCVSDNSKTQLDWYPQADAHRVAEYTSPRRVHTRSVQVASLDCPVPRAKPSTPGWYANTAAPPPPSSEPANYSPDPASIAFSWPLTGPVVADYGTTISGERNVGINIAVPFGTPIRAAAAGQISYAGNELRGYGNLVLIKHDDGYVTAYAHAERIVVNRGDVVQKGQIIGYAGQTGDVTSPQLHFEIRKGVTPVNPHTLLVASRAS